MAGLCLLLEACGDPDRASSLHPPTGPAPDAAGDSGAASDASDEPAKPTAGCSDEASFVYVLSSDLELYAFSPASKEFTHLGQPNCSMGFAGTFVSMAVDRRGSAWLNFRSIDIDRAGMSGLCRVDLETGVAEATGITGLIGGMAFSSASGNSEEETLFVLTADGRGAPRLGKVDVGRASIVPVADFEVPLPIDTQLAGTADGKLYAYLVTADPDPVGYGAIDKTTAKLSDFVPVEGLPRSDRLDQPFWFWHDDVYFYSVTDALDVSTTALTLYRPSTGKSSTNYMAPLDFRISAGSASACASVKPAKSRRGTDRSPGR